MEQLGGPRERRSAAWDSPPRPVQMRYYLWDTRVPPTWLGWVERDIHSPFWLAREVARFLATFFVVTAIAGRWNFTLLTLASLLLGVGTIIAMKEFLRRVAVAYQRYGWDWDGSQNLGVGPYVRVGLAVLFAVVFVFLTQ